MRCTRAHAIISLLLPALLFWADAAGAQRIETVGIRPPLIHAVSAGIPSMEPGQPSLLKHLAVGTVVGTVVVFTVGYAAVALTCKSSCEWAGLSVLLSTALGAGAGFVIGGVVYVVKRLNE